MGSHGSGSVSVEVEGILGGDASPPPPPRSGARGSMEQVWEDIQNIHHSHIPTQPGLEESRAEDFLVKAGAHQEEGEECAANEGMTFSYADATLAAAAENVRSLREQQEVEWVQFQLKAAAAACQQQLQCEVSVGGGGSGSGGGVNAGLVTPSPSSSRGCQGKKRMVERTRGERRQKRMIKNRESAARSRARKLAYTYELENEVILLKDANAKLKMQQVSGHAIPLQQSEETKTVLKRTRTAPF